ATQGAYFLNQSQTEQLTKLVVTPQRSLNPKIVGKPATAIAEWAGIAVPPNTRCLIAEIGGVGRDFPLSLEKLSPILTYYVANGLEDGSRLCDEILHYGGMGHTASVHTRDRDAALRYGILMPAARVVVNTPSTHGAIGFSTALPPSMTLGCGSWGGNVTSDNISPLHLMDIKRVAFETRPVTVVAGPPVQSFMAQPAPHQADPLTQSRVNPLERRGEREMIVALVDRFIAARQQTPSPAETSNAARREPPEVKEPVKEAATNNQTQAASLASPVVITKSESNGHRAVDFVCEEDVKRALASGEKIYVNAKTIVTPAARELGEPREVFAKAD
ncbi:MAG TPA: hypothetical protein VKG02_23850, partial [Blastocatellia bacterium]|nr:hypothetical protein [Blastocatellia bacterium]